MDIKKIIKEEMDDMEWIRKIPTYLSKDHRPKEGSVMICIPGFTKEWDNYKYDSASYDPNYGGGGYEKGKIITVKELNRYDGDGDRTVVWPEEGGHGIYVDALSYYY